MKKKFGSKDNTIGGGLTPIGNRFSGLRSSRLSQQQPAVLFIRGALEQGSRIHDNITKKRPAPSPILHPIRCCLPRGLQVRHVPHRLSDTLTQAGISIQLVSVFIVEWVWCPFDFTTNEPRLPSWIPEEGVPFRVGTWASFFLDSRVWHYNQINLICFCL